MNPTRQNHSAKRKRLSYACNYCRSQKKRCDEQKPSCRRCIAAGQICITTNPREPGAPEVERCRAVSKSPDTIINRLSGLSEETVSDQLLSRSLAPQDRDRQRAARSQKEYDSASTPAEASQSSELSMSTPMRALVAAPESLNDVRFSEATQHRLRQQRPNSQGNSLPDHQNSIPRDPSKTKHRSIAPKTSLTVGMQAAVNSDENSFRKKYVGASSLQVFAQWVDLALMTQGNTQRLSAGFRHGMQHAEEFDLPLSINLPSIMSLGNVQPYLEAYLDRINLLYPFVDEGFISQALSKFKIQTDIMQTSRTDIPELACLYAVISTAVAELNGCEDPLGKKLLQAAYSLISHIIAYPYFTSVQALGAIAIALRGRLKDGAASQVIGQAIRIAHSIGLHRGDISSTDPHAALYERVWCACYCLEKNIEFDSGRPSEVHDDFIGPGLISSYDPEPHFAQALLSLSQIQCRISRDIFSVKAAQSSAQDLMPILAEVDIELTAWTDRVSEIIRPGREFNFCPSNMLPQVTFLALQYYSTLAMIHRTSLLIDQELHRSVIEATCTSPRAKHRLLAGESICANAARSIVRCVNDMLARYGPSQLLSPQAPLLAVYILVIHTMRNPQSWTVDSDLNLIQKIASTAEKLYASNGQHPKFTAMCPRLYALATKIAAKATHSSTLNDNDTRNSPGSAHSVDRPFSSQNEERQHNNFQQQATSQTTAYGYNPRRLDRASATLPNSWPTDSLTTAMPQSDLTGSNPVVQDKNSSTRYSITWRPPDDPLSPSISSRAAHDQQSMARLNLATSLRQSQTSSDAVPSYSPSTIDRVWATTLSDSLDFLQMADIHPSLTHLPSSIRHPISVPAERMTTSNDGDSSLDHVAYSSNPGVVQRGDLNEISATERLSNPVSSNNNQTNQIWTLQEARHLFGMPWIYDLGPDLDSLYEDITEESNF